MIESVPISDTGIASSGMMAVRQRCRNSITTITARIIASSERLLHRVDRRARERDGIENDVVLDARAGTAP